MLEHGAPDPVGRTGHVHCLRPKCDGSPHDPGGTARHVRPAPIISSSRDRHVAIAIIPSFADAASWAPNVFEISCGRLRPEESAQPSCSARQRRPPSPDGARQLHFAVRLPPSRGPCGLHGARSPALSPAGEAGVRIIDAVRVGWVRRAPNWGSRRAGTMPHPCALAEPAPRGRGVAWRALRDLRSRGQCGSSRAAGLFFARGLGLLLVRVSRRARPRRLESAARWPFAARAISLVGAPGQGSRRASTMVHR